MLRHAKLDDEKTQKRKPGKGNRQLIRHRKKPHPVKTTERQNRKQAPKEKKPFEKKGKWGDRGSYRKDPNPDVIYGRDCEE